MVSLFGRGFDSLHLHHHSITKPLILNGLAAFFYATISFFDDNTAVGLMGGQYEHFGNLHVLWGVGGKDGNVGNIVARHGLDAFIDRGGPVVVSVETDVAEVGLHKSGLQVRHTDSSIGDIDAQTIGEC